MRKIDKAQSASRCYSKIWPRRQLWIFFIYRFSVLPFHCFFTFHEHSSATGLPSAAAILMDRLELKLGFPGSAPTSAGAVPTHVPADRRSAPLPPVCLRSVSLPLPPLFPRWRTHSQLLIHLAPDACSR